MDNPLIFKTMKHIYYFLILAAALLVSCGGAKSKKQEAKETVVEHYAPGTRQVEIDFDVYRYTSQEEFDEAIDRY